MAMITAFSVLISFTACVTAEIGIKWRQDYNYNEDAEGWFKLHNVPQTWLTAKRICSYEGAILASPTTSRMYKAIKDIVKGYSTDELGVFTGVHSIFSKGSYSSLEGVTLSRMPLLWMPREPDNADNKEDCLVIVGNGTIADVNCEHRFPYICYKKRTSDLFMTHCGTTDPEYKLDTNTGHCYKFHNFGKDWWRAYATCLAEGGYLAVANSETEANVLKYLIDHNPPEEVNGGRGGAFLGFLDWDRNGDWTTIHGSTLEDAGFAGWGTNQPDNYEGIQFCGVMVRCGLFDDENCDSRMPFICEKSPDSLL